MISISIVEDTTDIRLGLENLIKLQKNMVLVSSSACAEAAMPLIIKHQPNITIMDINMPGINGIECILQLKNSCPNTQFIIFTIYENDEQIFEALAAGATGYLLKKATTGQIIEALTNLHNGGSPMSNQIARKVIAYFTKLNNNTNNTQTPFLAALSKRENEVLQLLAKGYLYKEVAAKLNVANGTITQHAHNIYEKLQVTNKTEAINKFFGK